ncbi:FUSC family protein [Kitasatospora sp. NPDC058162]|uniref:FUSC family protein n=1 Tax=Kitasatospora sp. NPDC058162 TaxID=3346362 RepID=UPI0036DC8DB1
MPWLASLRDTARTGLHLDRTLTNPKRALRGAIAVALVLLPTLALAGPQLATSAAMGAFIAGTATFQRSFRPRPSLAVAAGIGLGTSTLIGYLAISVPGLFPVVLAVWALLAGLAWAVGVTAGVVAATTVSVMLVVVQLPVSVPTALGHGLLCAAGGAVQALLITLWPIDSWRAQRDALADAYTSLADHARQLREDPAAPADPEPLMTARHASELTPWQERHRPAELHGLRGLAEQVRPVLTAIADPRIGAPAEGPELDRARELLAAAAEVLDALAAAIRSGEPLHLPRSAPSLTLAPRTEEPMLHGPARAAAARLTSLLGQAVDVLDRASPDALGTPVTDAGSALSRPSLFGMAAPVLSAVRRQIRPGSTVLRHAVRLATVVTVADLVGRLTGLHHGYWAALTAAMVIRPDFAQTFSRGVARLAGTVVGVALATAVVLVLNPGAWLSAVLAVLCVCGAYLTNRTGYALMTACVSGYVVFLLGLVQPGNSLATAVERVGLTLVGGVVALLTYALFPSWESARLGERLAEWIAAAGRYGAAVLAVYGDPAAHSDREVRTALLDSREARSEFLQAMQRAEVEPVPESMRKLSHKQVEKARTAVGLLSRVGLLLEAHVPAKDAAPVPGAEAFATSLAEATAGAAAAILDGRPVDFSGLRAEQRAWERRLRESHEAVAAGDPSEQVEVVRAATRLLMQALDDLERAVRRSKAPSPRVPEPVP